jgi:putative hydrolase of the HAD superfamily
MSSAALDGVHLVVVDIDDTLYLERDYVRSGFRVVGEWLAGEYGAVGFEDAAWDLFVTGARGTIFDAALERLDVTSSPALIEALVWLYRTHLPDIELLPDAVRFWRERSRLGITGVITDGPLISQRRKIAALGLSPPPGLLVCTAELAPGSQKPDPAPFALLETELDCPARACAYVGDNPAKDFGGARARGWRTIRVRRADSLHAAVPSGDDVDFEVTSLEPLAPD